MKRLPFFAFLLALFPLGAQSPPVERIGIEQGLSQGFVTCLLQDREGFIWAGTQNGLNRFDGYRFQLFSHDPYDSTTLSGNFIASLCDAGDYLLVGTTGHGLNLFHKKTQRFFRLPHASVPGDTAGQWRANRLTGSTVFAVAFDQNRNIWTGTSWFDGAKWVSRITLPKGFWERLPSEPGLLADAKVRDWKSEEGDVFWLGMETNRIWRVTGKGLFSFDFQHDQWQPFPLPEALAGKWFNYFYKTPSGNSCLIQRGSDLWFFDGNAWSLAVPAFSESFIFYCDYPKSDLTWTNKNGVVKAFKIQGDLDRSDFSAPHWTIDTGDGRIFLFDRSGNLWLSANAGGLLKFSPSVSRIQSYFPGESVLCPPTATPGGNFIFDTNGSGLRFLNDKDKTLTEGLRQAFARNRLVACRLLEDKAGHFWMFGYDDRGKVFLSKTDPRTGSSQSWGLPFHLQRPNNFSIDEKGAVWFPAEGRLIRFDPATEKWTAFDYRNLNLSDKQVFALAKTADGSWWLATENGLLRAKPKGNDEFSFEVYHTNPADRNSLNSNVIASLLTDPKDPGILWIGTKGGGLNRLDTRTGNFTHLTTADGLPDNVIYGILPDEAGNLWLSSNRGLVRYNPETGEMKSFRKADGLQSDEFNTWAAAKGRNGELLFGGVNGLNVLNPKDLSDNPAKPNVFLTGLKINNLPVSVGVRLADDKSGILKEAIEFCQSIVLPFSKNNLTLEFAALEFTATSKNHFRYYLEGAEKEWAHESAEPFATYLNVQPGSYIFKVLGSNNDGVWSEQPAVLKIRILPPWYRSWLAWIFYALVLGSLIFSYLRFRLRRLRLQKDLEMEHREAKRMYELDKLKTDFYTNISHEFRTPLTVILGMAERAEAHNRDGAAAKIYQALELIKRNGHNLLRLINQMLDLSKLESGALRLHLAQGNVVAFVKYVLESFHSLAVAKNIQLHFLCEEAEIFMDYDREKLLSILYNLLSNAVKFTPAGGDVYVSLARRQPENLLVLKIRDTGEGISAEQLLHVFDRFFQANGGNSSAVSSFPTSVGTNSTGSSGTGIGLALVKELVKMMNGEVNVKSKPGVGTEFMLALPITRLAAPDEPSGKLGGNFKLPPNFSLSPEPAHPSLINHQSTIITDDLPLLLVVEDNPDVAHYIVSCVESRYSVVLATNGEEGISRAIELVPDLVLSDVMMPKKDGYELCAALKNDERTSHVPVVLLTAKADAASKIEGLRRGADAYLAKPFDVQELLVTLENLIELRRSLQARFALAEPPAPEDLDVEIEDAFLKKVKELVEANLDDADFDVVKLSRKLGLSRSQVFRKIKALTGKPTNVYVRSLRLQKGRELLKNSPKLSVSEIAYQVGFSDPAYFSRAYSEEFGEAPLATRK